MNLSRDTMINWAEVHRVLDDPGLDVLLAVSPENTFYFSGVFIRTQVSIRERLAFVVVPREGDPTFVVCNIEESLARTQGWLRDVRTSVFGGYASDIARMGVVGSPTRAQRDAYRVLYDVHRETIAHIAPSMTFAELYQYCKHAFARHGYTLPNPHVGHNLSLLGGHEDPLIQPFAHEPMRPGMMLCVEPSLQMTPDTRMHLEDLVLVTEHGPKILCWWDATELLVFD